MLPKITTDAMLTRWRRMSDADVKGAYDIYKFLKGAIEYAERVSTSNDDDWEDTLYSNSNFSDMVEPYLNGFKYENQRGETGSFNVWHTHGVKVAYFSAAAFEDLEQYIFKSRIGSYLYAGISDIPTYREIWENMNRPAMANSHRKSRNRRNRK